MFIKAMIYMNVRRIRHVPYFKTVKKLRELFMRQFKKKLEQQDKKLKRYLHDSTKINIITAQVTRNNLPAKKRKMTDD